jgi:glycosyltransferase involved in cell wall biosynthesis
LNADLFVFASQIEYSPLVLFEAAASGTPFLTTPVGNAEELIGWLGGGFLIEAEKDVSGYLRVKPDALALEVAVLMSQKPMLQEMGRAMKSRWRHHYTWDTIASEYERVLTDCLDTN